MKAKIRSVLFPYWYEVWKSNRRAYNSSLTAKLEKLDQSRTLIYGLDFPPICKNFYPSKVFRYIVC